MCLKNIGTVCFAQTTLATVIKSLFFKMVQCLVVAKMQFQHSVTNICFFTGFS